MKRGWCPDLHHAMPSGDGWLVRVKPRLARISAADLRLLGEAACRHGSGIVELTSRANLQVRGLAPQTVAPFAAEMVAAGLADADPAAERRRNVLVGPLAGADAVATALLALIAAAPDLDALPDKFGFAVQSNGRGDVVLRRSHDGWMVGDVACTEAEAAPLAIAAARATLAGAATPHKPLPLVDSPVIGWQAGKRAFGLGLPSGQCPVQELADLATRFGDGMVYLTPHRAVLIGGVDDPAALAAATSLITTPDDPRARIIACPGRPACASAMADTRGDAAWLAQQAIPGRLHLSACSKGCAHPMPGRTLVATGRGYALVPHGRAGDPPAIHFANLADAAAHLRKDAA